MYDLLDDSMKLFGNYGNKDNKIEDHDGCYRKINNKTMPKPLFDNNDDTKPIDSNGNSMFINNNQEINMNVFEYNNRNNEGREDKCSIKLINYN